MATKEEAAFSLADLDAASSSARGVERQYFMPDGTPTPLWLTILGSNAPAVSAAINAYQDAEARREQAAASQFGFAAMQSQAEKEEAIAKLAAVRIGGWRGVKEPYSPSAALSLVKSNPHLLAFVVKTSNDIANFLRVADESAG